jgi:hypothetical protein
LAITVIEPQELEEAIGGGKAGSIGGELGSREGSLRSVPKLCEPKLTIFGKYRDIAQYGIIVICTQWILSYKKL